MYGWIIESAIVVSGRVVSNPLRQVGGGRAVFIGDLAPSPGVTDRPCPNMNCK